MGSLIDAAGHLFRRLRKLWRESSRYPRYRDKALSFYNVLLISRKLAWIPFPGRHKVVNVRLRGHSAPFAVRLGSTDWLVLVEIFVDGEYAAAKELFGGSQPETILDLGANAGFSIRYWLETFPGARIVGVEPDPGNLAMIRRNVALLQPALAPYLVEACIVGRPRTEVLIDYESGREWAFAMTNASSATTRSVAAVTADQLISDASIQGRIGLLKCDIEGAESELFEHCQPWIQRVDHGVVEVHGKLSRQGFASMLRDRGVDVEEHASRKGNLCVFDVRCASAHALSPLSAL